MWIDTLKLDARVLRHDTADARGVHYRLSGVHFPRKRGDEWPLSASWQARLDTVWVDISDTFVHSSDSLLVRRDELRGIRTYATDGMEVYYATLRYRPLGLRCPGGGVPAS
ncbi:MAG: hypothetical protein H0U85_01820 [Gemmatimonadales bacterium]|nr:hypothetical protein [Gemmatimonadales bacterium]